MGEIGSEKIAQGKMAEQEARRYFQSKGYELFQVDWIVLNPDTGEYVLVEVKGQEHYKAPPFDGHGLPKWQIDARLAFEERTGIKAFLFIVDTGTGIIYGEWLRALEEGEHYDTKGEKPRRIYPLSNFGMRRSSCECES